jgi:RNA-binding protein
MSQTPVTLQFGKDALTDTWLEEFRDQLKRRKVVKVRFLNAGRSQKSTKDWALEVATKTGARLVDVRGFTATFEAGPRAT